MLDFICSFFDDIYENSVNFRVGWKSNKKISIIQKLWIVVMSWSEDLVSRNSGKPKWIDDLKRLAGKWMLLSDKQKESGAVYWKRLRMIRKRSTSSSGEILQPFRNFRTRLMNFLTCLRSFIRLRWPLLWLRSCLELICLEDGKRTWFCIRRFSYLLLCLYQ